MWGLLAGLVSAATAAPPTEDAAPIEADAPAADPVEVESDAPVVEPVEDPIDVWVPFEIAEPPPLPPPEAETGQAGEADAASAEPPAPPPPPPTLGLSVGRVYHASVHLETPRWGVAALELDIVADAIKPHLRTLDDCLEEARRPVVDMDAKASFTVSRRGKLRAVQVWDGVDAAGPVDRCLRETLKEVVVEPGVYASLPIEAEITLLQAQNPAAAARARPIRGEPQTTQDLAVTRQQEGLRSSVSRAYHDEAILVGVLYAPGAAQPEGPAATSLLARFHLVRAERHWRVPVVWGLTTDVRGLRTVSTHTQVVAGVHLLPRQATRLAFTTGLGLSQRSLFPTTDARFWVPVRASVRWFSDQWPIEVLGRGGGNVGYDAEGNLVVDPDVVIGISVEPSAESTASRSGFRLELGWRREWGVPTFTSALGVTF